MYRLLVHHIRHHPFNNNNRLTDNPKSVHLKRTTIFCTTYYYKYLITFLEESDPQFQTEGGTHGTKQ